MNVADWVIVAVIAISCVISLWRGFVKEALSMAVWALAFFVAMTFAEGMNTFLADSIETASLRQITSFGILFVLTLIVGSMVNFLVSELVKMTGLSGTDRLLGTVFGAMRGVILVLAVLILAPPILHVDQDAWWRESALIPQFLVLESWGRETGSIVFNWVTSKF